MDGLSHLKSMSNRKSNQLSCLQALPANTRWLVAIISQGSIGVQNFSEGGGPAYCL